MPLDGRRPTRKEMFLQHVIVFAICVVFPGITTACLPATWVRLSRDADVVHCQTWTCVFFVVPFQVQSLNGVTGVEFREIAGRTDRVRERGHTTNKTVHVDGRGFLQFLGAKDRMIEVSVSPASRASVLAKARQFLTTPETTSKTFFTIANWKFGAIMGGILTLFTAIYVFSYTMAFLKFLYDLTMKPRIMTS